MKTGAIVDLPSMISARSFLSAKLLGNSIYVFGGENSVDEAVGTVERYNGMLQILSIAITNSNIYVIFIVDLILSSKNGQG